METVAQVANKRVVYVLAYSSLLDDVANTLRSDDWRGGEKDEEDDENFPRPARDCHLRHRYPFRQHLNHWAGA